MHGSLVLLGPLHSLKCTRVLSVALLGGGWAAREADR